jgi:hypothetical protein
VTQPQNESTLALINLTLAAVSDARELLEHVRNRDRESRSQPSDARGDIELCLRFAEIYLSALVQKLDRIETICTDAVRDDSTVEELYHRVQDVLHATRVHTAAPTGQKESTDGSKEEDQ